MGNSISSMDRMTVGIDLGDRRSHYVVMDVAGAVIEEGQLATRPEALPPAFRRHGHGAGGDRDGGAGLGGAAARRTRLRGGGGEPAARQARVGQRRQERRRGRRLPRSPGPRRREAAVPGRAAQCADAGGSRGAAGSRALVRCRTPRASPCGLAWRTTGSSDLQLRITKDGNPMARRLLVTAAHPGAGQPGNRYENSPLEQHECLGGAETATH